jgi:hypothetical protein
MFASCHFGVVGESYVFMVYKESVRLSAAMLRNAIGGPVGAVRATLHL